MDDYIERDALLADISAAVKHRGMGEIIGKTLMRYVKRQPAADVAPVLHGRWEQDADGDWYCSNCDEVVAICESGRERTYRKPYCPNCGAKMDGGDSDAAD